MSKYLTKSTFSPFIDHTVPTVCNHDWVLVYKHTEKLIQAIKVDKMMSDTTFLTPSTWASDFTSPKESLLPDYDLLSALPFDTLDHDISRQDSQSLTSWTPDWDTPSSYQNSEISVANSECSDSHSVDIDGDLEDALLLNVGDRDFLSSAVVTSQHNTLTGSEPVELTPLDPGWSDHDDDDDIWEPLSGTDDSTTHHDTTRTFSEIISHNIQWASLHDEEKVCLVEELSSIVSSSLGLREQLEVIRIISPDTSVSPTDTQFVIDVSCMDDEKLREICLFLHQQTLNNNNNLNDKKTSRSAHHSNRVNHHGNTSKQSHHDNGCYGHTSDGDSNSNSSRHRKSKKRAHRQLNQKRRAPQQKRIRQELKEKRSGLFTREQVVAVETTDSGELDDIDILT